MKESEVLTMLAELEAVYNHSLNDLARKIWCQMLADLEPDAARAAAQTHMATNRFFPTIAEIRSLATQRELGAPDEADAWEQAKALARHRPLNGIAASGEAPAVHSLVARAVHAIGPDYIANSYEDDPWPRQRFTEMYRHLQIGAEHRLALGESKGAALGDSRLRELAERVGKEPK